MLQQDATVEIHRFVCGPADNNAYLVKSVRTSQSVIIDAPAGPGSLIEAARGTLIQALLITHGHGDHLAGLDELLSAFDVPVGIGDADRDALLHAGVTPQVDVSDGTVFRFGDPRLMSIHVPGHTPGSTAFLLPPSGARSGALFGGDTLFPGGPGTTGSPEDFQQIIKSIRERLFTLPNDTVVLTGHGESTTIEEAIAEYTVFESRPHRHDLFGTLTWDDRS
jgi:glyoxylase-like metal-dependent hydrolase (beta-lactamase superfamily II)